MTGGCAFAAFSFPYDGRSCPGGKWCNLVERHYLAQRAGHQADPQRHHEWRSRHEELLLAHALRNLYQERGPIPTQMVANNCDDRDHFFLLLDETVNCPSHGGSVYKGRYSPTRVMSPSDA